MTAGVSIPYGGPGTVYSGYKMPWEKVERQIDDIIEADKLPCFA